ncbi:helix-turn-helix domain-containing protein [Marinitoga lauensis]|uniref:helix-turn-helix domain-containing protein n=1 Tax=Marinitoga lauensis TaxID=2201189 RepID=UPI0010133F2A|nr:helix-turn-helix transcriptional regulator [Marinitoga lauensis]
MIKHKVKKLLKERDKSLYWLSQKTGLSYPNLHKLIKNDTHSINFDTLDKIMKALEITDFNEILEFVHDERKTG